MTPFEVMGKVRMGLASHSLSWGFNAADEAVSAEGTIPLIVLENEDGELFTVVVVAGNVIEDLRDGASLDCLIDEEYED